MLDRKCFVLCWILFCFFTAPLYAQLDPGFGSNGTITAVTDAYDRPIGSFIVSEGKILLVNGDNASSVYQFLRFNADGSPDLSYGVNGRVTLSIPFINAGYLYKAIRQTDGKIVLVGTDVASGIIIRLYEDGTLDTSFSIDGIHRPNIDQSGGDGLSDVVQQPDGKLVAAGYIRNSQGQYSVIRYEPDGEVDPSFGDRGGFIVHPAGPQFGDPTIALQTNGKFLIFSINYFNGQDPPRSVYRLESDGEVDNSFASPQVPGNPAFLRVLGNDKFIVGGYRSKTDNLFRTDDDITVRRYDSDGHPDVSFGVGGVAAIDVTSAFSDLPFDLAELPDGKIIIGASTHVPANRSSTRGYQVSLIRLTPDGVTDGKYLVADIGANIYGYLILQPDGKIITATQYWDSNFGMNLRLTRSIGIPSPTYRFHGIPFHLNLQFNHAVAAVYRAGTQRWYTDPGSVSSIFFGLPGDILVPSDFLGTESSFFSLHSEVAVFRPGTGTWYIGKDYFNASQNFVAVQWGTNGDVPVPADYDGDGKSDIAVFRPSTGIWYIRNIGDNSAWAQHWGIDGDKPVVGDYDGDGIYDLAVWRPSDGFWYILRSSDGQPSYIPFGINGDVPVQEDFDGDGKFDIAVWRPSNGFWYVLRSSDGGITYFNWGLATDIPSPADYDGDHKTDFAVWRPSTRIWYINYSSGVPTEPFIFGAAGDVPVPGRY